jgi:hypothetical protein
MEDGLDVVRAKLLPCHGTRKSGYGPRGWYLEARREGEEITAVDIEAVAGVVNEVIYEVAVNPFVRFGM